MNKWDFARVLSYDSGSGLLTWRARPREMFATERAFKAWSKRYSGRVAGKIDVHGYTAISAYGKTHLAHRVIWQIVTGEWPKKEIDHINGARDDNRWCNLREATRAENCRNKAASKSVSGRKGVYSGRCGRWRSQICADRKIIHLGVFDTIEEASAAYNGAAKKYHGEFARLS